MTHAKKQASKKQASKQQASKQQARNQQARKKQASKKQASKKRANKKQASKKRANKKKATPLAAGGEVGEVVRGLRTFALGLPEAVEEFPWDHSALKVRKKVFLFLPREGTYGETASLSVKLPHTAPLALTVPGAAPTGYGLGRAGWVSLRLEPGACPPVEMLCEWVLESYRAIAPKRLVTSLDATGP